MPLGRRIPWIILFEAVIAAHRRWRDLHPDDRSRLAHLVRKSRGRPYLLTRDERSEFRQIASRLDLVGLGREMLPLGRRLRRHRGR
jgi:hypothetical protein